MTSEHEAFVFQSLKEIMLRNDRPTGVFCGFDSEAELIYLLLGRLGVHVPHDVSLMGFGGSWREGAITRRLVSVTLDEEQLGRNAVTFLNEMRQGERQLNDMSEIVMPLSLSGGETLGNVPAMRKRVEGMRDEEQKVGQRLCLADIFLATPFARECQRTESLTY